MRDLIEYLMAILNIKTDSSFVVLDMQNELQDIIDIADYQKFIRKNINYLGMEYMTGFQKFIKLTEIYKRQYAEAHNQERLEASRNTAKELSQKVKTVSEAVENGAIFHNMKIKGTNENYFTNWELKELSKRGGSVHCVGLQKSVSGSDELYEKLKEQMREIVMVDMLDKPKETTSKKILDMTNVKRF